MVSIYTFKGSNILKQGDIVKVGQYMGSVSELNPEVYFELWINGKAVNPESYIAF
jgi:septal ring factor EnvC (AmiA/AmiB activator)